jgi:hypothetical protein
LENLKGILRIWRCLFDEKGWGRGTRQKEALLG